MKRPAAADAADKAGSRAKTDGAPTLAVARRTLTPKDVTAGCVWLGLGPAGNGEDFGQEAINAAVAAAVAAGVTEFDTAPLYGAGSSEARLGKAVVALADAKIRVITKVGRVIREPDGVTVAGDDIPSVQHLHDRVILNDFTAAGAERCFRESLARMGVKSIWGLRVHDPNDNPTHDGKTDEVAVSVSPGGACEALRKLKKEGLIQHVSLGMNCNREAHQGKPEEILRLIRDSPSGTFDSALLAGGWNLLSQEGLPCLLECQERGVEVHVAGVYASGLLVGGSNYAYLPAPAAMLEKTEKWRVLAEKHGASLPAVAIAFSTAPVCVKRVVIGMACEEQMRKNLELLEEAGRVPSGIWTEARELGLLPAHVPTPP